jgi:hypothetical protein
MREICTSGSTRGELVAHPCRLLSYSTGFAPRRGLRIVRQQPIPVIYESVRIDTGFRADLIVEDKVIGDQISLGADQRWNHPHRERFGR